MIRSDEEDTLDHLDGAYGHSLCTTYTGTGPLKALNTSNATLYNCVMSWCEAANTEVTRSLFLCPNQQSRCTVLD